MRQDVNEELKPGPFQTETVNLLFEIISRMNHLNFRNFCFTSLKQTIKLGSFSIDNPDLT